MLGEEWITLESRTFPSAGERISGCARCGGEHSDYPTHAFFRPVEDEFITWGWWFTCPTTGDPVLIAKFPPGTPRGMTHLEVVDWLRSGEDRR